MLSSIFRGGRYTEEHAKLILVQILSVVAFCHLQGVVHRDLKPEVCALNVYPLLLFVIFTSHSFLNCIAHMTV